jgi:hypothetical protein
LVFPSLLSLFTLITAGHIMAERKRNRRNTLERRCLSKALKRMFVGAPKGTFKMLEKLKVKK